MARNIALTITLNGVEQTINSVEDLEQAIAAANQQLEELDENSDAFKNLQQDIKGANNTLDAINQSLGTTSKNFEETAKTGGLMSKAFSAANTALSSFGIDSKKIGEAAKNAFNKAKDSVNGMTQSLIDTGDKLTEIPGPIGQVAQGVKGLGQAIKILLANPIVAFFAAIVAVLTTLYKAFTSTKAGAETMERVFAALGAVVDVLRDRFLKFAEGVGKLFTGDLMGAVEAFKGSYQGIGAEIAEEAKAAAQITGELQKVTDATRELNKERAEQNRLIAEAKLKINDETLSYEERLAALKEAGDAEQALADKEAAIAKRRFEAIVARNALSDSSKEALDEEAQAFIDLQNAETASLLKRKELADQAKALRDRQRAEEKAAADARKRELEAELKLLADIRAAQLAETRELIKRALAQRQLVNDEVKIVKTLTDRLTALKTLEGQYKTLIPIEEEAIERFAQISDIPTDEAYNDLQAYLGVIEQINKQLADPPKESREELNQLFASLNELANAPTLKPFISPAAAENLTLLNTEIKQFGLVLNDIQGLQEKMGGVFLNINFGALINEAANLRKELSNPLIEPSRALEAEEQLSGIEKSFIEAYKMLRQQDEEYLKAVKENDNARITVLDNNATALGKIYFDIGLNAVQTFNKFKVGAVDANAQVELLRFQIKQLQPTELFDYLNKNAGVLQKAFEIDANGILQNRQKVENINEEILNRTFDADRKYAADVIGLQNMLAAKKIDISKLSYEQQLVLLAQFLNAQLTEEEIAAAKSLQIQNEKRDAFIRGVQEFQGVLNSLQQSLNDYYDLSFDKLEVRNRELQAQINEDTADGVQKRLDLEKQYQAEKIKLEKRAAKSALAIQLAQTIANIATSVTAALKTGIPVVSQLAAATNAAIGAVQVGIITSQLNMIDRMQRGGKIRKGQGGLVVGPSHEMGGVRFGQQGLELEGGEAVINRMSTVKYGDLLNEINMAGGGKPIINNNFDDSRLLEALAKQRSEPIRAFVVESDITNKQTITKRLDQLSKV